ncbi:hypothetical protein AB7783_02980 [Tardiphaga sp. 172_B4_N1_3]|uniref:hypothetical protein n=1 Tax=Tardiphaga sp. 172_B4_N1_3 TaxID=3240787 RepID=UPI003F8C6213
MISNIIDRRKSQHRWKLITAIIEPTYHDNLLKDADQADDPGPDAYDYDERAAISLSDAVVWAQALPFEVTLFLYDLGQGINTVSLRRFRLLSFFAWLPTRFFRSPNAKDPARLRKQRDHSNFP